MVTQRRTIGRVKALLDKLGASRRRGVGAERPETMFFIVGQARSGTTWLRGILNAHPEIMCWGEGRFFERSFVREDIVRSGPENIAPVSLYGALSESRYLRAWMERSVWARGKGAEEHLANLTRLAVDYFLAEQLAGTGKTIVGDKTPFVSAEFVEEIAGVYPEAKVIHIVRDGRDVAVSRIHHMWNNAKGEGGIYDLAPEELERRDAFRGGLPGAGGLFTAERLGRIAADWSAGVGEVTEAGPALLGANYSEVRYEDLLGEPVAGVRRLLAFLGAEAGERAAKGCVEAASFERGAKRERGQEDSSSRYRKGVAGDWKNAFTEGDKRVFKEAAGGLLVKLGYEKGDDW